jgi:hypothetical protein
MRKAKESRRSADVPGLTVEVAAIEAHARDMRRRESTSLDLWIVLPGLDRYAAADAVRAAAAGDTGIELVYPTSGGTYVWVADSQRWTVVVERLSQALAAAGVEGSVTAPRWVDPAIPLRPTRRSLTALLAFAMDPPPQAGPFNRRGILEYRWGVPPETTNEIADDAARWGGLAGERGQLGGAGPAVPATTEDAGELVGLRLATGQRDVRVTFFDGPEDPARSVAFSWFGQVMYADIAPARGLVDVALDHGTVLRTHAARLDVGSVLLMPTMAGSVQDLEEGGALMTWNRHLWSSRVHDAQGIQLLTSAHLDQAHDLSGWDVEEVAADRWLVSARDLQPWYDLPDYQTWRSDLRASGAGTAADWVPAHLASARRDFGDMILTAEIAAAHPLGPR